MSVLRKLKNLPEKKPLAELDHSKIIEEVKNICEIESHIDRSFAQFLSLKKSYKNPKLAIIADIISIFPLVISLIYYSISAIYNRFKSNNHLIHTNKIAVLPNINIVPSDIDTINDFHLTNKQNMKAYFELNDLLFIKKHLFKKTPHTYFFLKCTYKIFKYSGIAKSKAKIVYVSNEYDFTSSTITLYLNYHGKKVINCMHGEKLLNCRDAFCTYDSFIIWDEHYKKLFQRMYCKTHYTVSNCDAIKLPKMDSSKTGKKFVTYFLQGNESNKDLSSIKKNLEELKTKYNAKKILVKEHPRYKLKNINSYFDKDNVFDGDLIDVINSSLVVSGSYTTILFQVFKSRGNNNFPKIYIKKTEPLKKLKYIMLDKADGFFN